MEDPRVRLQWRMGQRVVMVVVVMERRRHGLAMGRRVSRRIGLVVGLLGRIGVWLERPRMGGRLGDLGQRGARRLGWV